ncbi:MULTISPECIES: helix-turn-helix transcriptional regulator [Nostocales]|uniref:Helix-turn-helix transcriptional regulator n=3 Tax=Nostocales TaxID=1161 RepID=A0A0C1R6I7_9CYAN|nr:LuxR C-terminal-related transcriptional regulator [Tolypothrix bouteillei]KAF3887387.1 helix-turn-helix transcriptional regulator [Tolypothrix bouteillei VB521301]
MITITKTFPTKLVQTQQPYDTPSYDVQAASFLQEVIESLQDGILILTKTGELIHANTSAHHILAQLNKNSACSDVVPTAIWSLCKSLLENKNFFPEESIVLSNEIALDKATVFRVRIRWLNIDRLHHSCFLVTIENRYESLKNIALTEIKKYDLTPREAEIWCLYRAKFSYKEIANQLYITVNTVKKHMKNIHAKRHNSDTNDLSD